jgi:hypothetical protein
LFLNNGIISTGPTLNHVCLPPVPCYFISHTCLGGVELQLTPHHNKSVMKSKKPISLHKFLGMILRQAQLCFKICHYIHLRSPGTGRNVTDSDTHTSISEFFSGIAGPLRKFH